MRVLIIDPIETNRTAVRKRLLELFPDIEILEEADMKRGFELSLQERFDALLVADHSNVSHLPELTEAYLIANSAARCFDEYVAVLTSCPPEEVEHRITEPNVFACWSFRAPQELYRRMKRDGRVPRQQQHRRQHR